MAGQVKIEDLFDSFVGNVYHNPRNGTYLIGTSVGTKEKDSKVVMLFGQCSDGQIFRSHFLPIDYVMITEESDFTDMFMRLSSEPKAEDFLKEVCRVRELK